MITQVKKRLQPYLARVISSGLFLALKRVKSECIRVMLRQSHRIDVYLRINDPYSYLLVQVLAELEQRFDIVVNFYTVKNLAPNMFPEPEMWQRNGFIDATHLANLYALNFPQQAPDHYNSLNRDAIEAVEEGSLQLLALEALSQQGSSVDWLAVQKIFDNYWFVAAQEHDLAIPHAEALPSLERQLAQNEQSLLTRGHYMSAMVHYAGEWYWGIDRLDHLEKRLNSLKATRPHKSLNSHDPSRLSGDDKLKYNRTYHNFCAPSTRLKLPNSNVKKLVLYFSIRSPYSYLGLQQAIKLAQHYQCELEIKPVLPMIMRGLSVPNTKKMYIFYDTKREAAKLGIEYGFVADPLGKGVERCYQLFDYAKRLGCERQYLLNYAQAVNAQGIHSDTDKGLRLIVQRSGMDWPTAQRILADSASRDDWQAWAEHNRQDMLALGSWGVPTFKYDDLVLWGQDRIGLIEQRILRDINAQE